MRIEIDITKTDLNTVRKRLGIKTNTRADVILSSLVKTVVDDEYALIFNRW